MKVAGIIQARMGSRRLPGKVLRDISGKTLLERVVDRVCAISSIDHVLVATSADRSDDPVADACGVIGVDLYRGSPDDVLHRYIACARFVDADAIVRVTADCPLLDVEVSERVVQAFLDQRPDYASNVVVGERTYPRGLDTEVVSTKALCRQCEKLNHERHRTHVTLYIRENPREFQMVSVRGDRDLSEQRWTVDEEPDLEFVRHVYDGFSGRDIFTFQEVLQLIEGQPEIVVNAMVQQKSLREI